MKVKGIYDGTQVVLLEPLPLPPNTSVEVLIPDMHEQEEARYWQQLLALGLVTTTTGGAADEVSFTPIAVNGLPISQSILAERR